jgi:oligosaccharide repeat unit polymerase
MNSIKALIHEASTKLTKVGKCRLDIYITVIVISTACALLFSYGIPNEYAAQAKISDEYKTTDLLVGLNSANVLLRDLNVNYGNEGTDDIEIYSKVLKSEDFINEIAHVFIPKYNQNYLDYLANNYKRPLWERPFYRHNPSAKGHEQEIKEIIKNNIRYNFSTNTQTLEIQVKDQNPQVAAVVLEQTLSHLKSNIERLRTHRAIIDKENAATKRKEASLEYQKAKRNYDNFADSHKKISSDYIASRLVMLQKDYQLKYDIYKKASEEYIRADYLVKKENYSFAIVKKYNLSQKPISPYHWAYAVATLLITSLICMWHYLFTRKSIGHHLHSFDFGNWFSPWTITLFIWIVIIGLYHILDTKLYPITSQFYNCLAIWLPVFCICSLIMYNTLPSKKNKYLWDEGLDVNKIIFNSFFILSLIITPLYVYRVLQIVMMFSTEDLMSNVRTLALYGEGQGLLNYSIVINQSLFIVALWAHPKVPTWQVVTLAIACLMNSLAIMEKESMFFVFTSIIFVLFEKKVIRLRSILIFSSILIFVFYLFNLGRAQEGSEYREEETLLDFFAMYVLSPPVAFCQLMQDLTPQFGTNTFEKIYVFLARFGVSDIVVKEKLQEFVWVPIPTNVYTCFQPFFIDFGYKGIAFFSGVYGCLCGGLYRLYRNKSGIGCGLYTYVVFALVLQFYQENIFHSLVFLLQFTFFVTLFTQKKIKLSFNIKP